MMPHYRCLGSVLRLTASAGNASYVELENADGKRYSIPVTQHLYDLKEVGPISPEVIEEDVRSELDDYTLGEEDIHTVLDDCSSSPRYHQYQVLGGGRLIRVSKKQGKLEEILEIRKRWGYPQTFRAQAECFG
ncbi:MAG: hypothetical protein ACE5H4_05540 [Candidatus Thorarchaeota archaeon]